VPTQLPFESRKNSLPRPGRVSLCTVPKSASRILLFFRSITGFPSWFTAVYRGFNYFQSLFLPFSPPSPVQWNQPFPNVTPSRPNSPRECFVDVKEVGVFFPFALGGPVLKPQWLSPFFLELVLKSWDWWFSSPRSLFVPFFPPNRNAHPAKMFVFLPSPPDEDAVLPTCPPSPLGLP